MAHDHDLKWFAKEVRSIIIRNLSPEKEILIKIPSPHLTIHGIHESFDRILFSSNPEYHTCNPSWTLSTMITVNPLPSTDVKDLLFSVLDEKTGNALVEYAIDLRKIVLLGNIHLTTIDSLPLNSIFLTTDNGYYTTEKLSGQLKKLGLLSAFIRNVGEYDDETDVSESATVSNIDATQERVVKLRDEVDSTFAKLETSRKAIEVQSKRAQLELLQLELAMAKCELEKEEELERQELQQLQEMKDMRKELQCCQDLVEECSTLTQSCRVQKQELLKLQFMHECRQLKLLSELLGVYPIERLDNGEYAIRGIELNNSNLDGSSQRDDEAVSSGLGYVVHMLVLASKYLEVPLRYQLLFYASRSMIRDPVTVRNSYPYMRDPAVDVTAQPLYKKGVEPARFLIAMDWLRRDVDQLLSTRGVTYNPSHGLLQNILHLFSCELCPTMAS